MEHAIRYRTGIAMVPVPVVKCGGLGGVKGKVRVLVIVASPSFMSALNAQMQEDPFPLSFLEHSAVESLEIHHLRKLGMGLV